MSMDNVYPQILPCPKPCSSRGSLLQPEVHSSEEQTSVRVFSADEEDHLETDFPLPSSLDLSAQETPDSSTSPKTKVLPSTEEKDVTKEGEVPVKKAKSRTVFSPSQLGVLHDRFQKQKYLSLQQMQELSVTLNLSYKQVKTWFQNQRMKLKRCPKDNWPEDVNNIALGSGPLEYPSISPSGQGCLVNSPESLPMWNISNWTNPPWSSQPWNQSQNWYNQVWNNQTWDNQLWSDPAYTLGEESLQLRMQLQQHFSASDLEAIWDPSGESYTNTTQQTSYFHSEQTIDWFLNTMPQDL